MADELLVASAVRAYAAHLQAGDGPTTERAVAAAVRAHLAGASVSEASRWGRQLLESQARHPSCRRRPRRPLACEGRPAPCGGPSPLSASGGSAAASAS